VLLVRAFASGMLRRPGAPCGPAASPVVLDVNRASIGELTALPGIGRLRAEAIVLHRVRHGPFATVGDLARVDGIGPETVAGLLPHASAGPAAAPR
jgi:competence protein ComEA